MTSITINRLEKSYNTGPALAGVNITASEGEFIALLGPSGCGKTTVLRCLAGLEDPDGGEIRLGDRIVYSPIDGVKVPVQKRGLGLVFQNYALWPHMTVAENISYPLKLRRYQTAVKRSRVDELLDLVGMTEYATRRVPELSGGQQQRVALARALAARPEALLLDEPLSNLDARRRQQLRGELRRIHRDLGGTIVYVTHDRVEALTLPDRIYVMNNGRVEQTGSPREVFTNPVNTFVADFIGIENIFEATVTTDSTFDASSVSDNPSDRAVRGTVTVRPDGWNTDITARTAAVLHSKDRIHLAVKASSIQIRDATDDDIHHAGVVNDVTYIGDGYQVTLTTGDQKIVIVTDDSRIPSVGDNVGLVFDQHGALALKS
ncbi:Spermidine/putrescine import ATP-binding protein PotA [Corynebacterium provencense]|uniref:ABC-type quaternary amine transporter n=1 Tax=Corynebacterium provencense TaxID=1737425 RepID=A0A2Z3YNU9_9CORY|nr:ABC transporter ATP-binding protein [Corynebacterium provencense]AWT24961.1 Spermidine/putrescine import ATP-binding protein PotA [Corynebacterium provencense]